MHYKKLNAIRKGFSELLESLFSRPEKLHFSKNKKIFIFIKGVKVYGADRQRTTGVY